MKSFQSTSTVKYIFWLLLCTAHKQKVLCAFCGFAFRKRKLQFTQCHLTPSLLCTSKPLCSLPSPPSQTLASPHSLGQPPQRHVMLLRLIWDQRNTGLTAGFTNGRIQTGPLGEKVYRPKREFIQFLSKDTTVFCFKAVSNSTI